MKWIGGNSYRRIADILQDMNELSRLIENEGSQGKSLFPDALAEDKEGHAAKRFALKEGVLTQEFVLKRMKRLSNGVWVVDMEQFLRDLLRLPQVAEVWDFGPPPPQHNPEGIWRRDDFDGDEMKSIFDGDAYRTHPLLCGGLQREWSRDRLIKKYQEALDRGERTEDETDVGEESENEEGEEEEEEIEDGLDGGCMNDGASDCASDDEAADLAAHFHARKNRAREDERVQAIRHDSLKEMWVWFGTSNDDATLSNPLQKGATKCLQFFISRGGLNRKNINKQNVMGFLFTFFLSLIYPVRARTRYVGDEVTEGCIVGRENKLYRIIDVTLDYVLLSQLSVTEPFLLSPVLIAHDRGENLSRRVREEVANFEFYSFLPSEMHARGWWVFPGLKDII